MSGRGGLRLVSLELLCEGASVPGVPAFDYLALGKGERRSSPFKVEGLSGRRPRSPRAEVVDPPMRGGELGFGRHDVSLGDEVVHVVLKSGRAVSQADSPSLTALVGRQGGVAETMIGSGKVLGYEGVSGEVDA